MVIDGMEQMVIRIPLEMKEWLFARARENCRSENGEINHVLKEKMAAEKRKKA
jgi:hypothetical protein